MKVVIDTNVLLISIPSISRYRPIFQGIIDNQFELAVSNDIISEYIEIIGQRSNPVVAKNVMELLLNLPNVKRTEVYYKWNLITADYDDNKFVDCAIAANVKFIVSNDKHFKILKEIDFPFVDIISADQFLEDLKKENEI